MPIQLLIKSPNQQVEDLKVQCDLSWTVGELKDHLSNEYPTKPAKSQQKLIYSGRLLNDHLKLSEVFTQGIDSYTMHLVCPHSTNSNKDVKSPDSENQADMSSSSNVSYPNVIPTAVNADALRQRFVQQQPYLPNPNNIYTPPMSHLTQGLPPYMAYQMALMQQSYAQAMAQYWTQSNTGYQNNMYGIQQASGPSPSPQNPPPARTAQNPDANRRQRVMDEDEEDHVDLLDSIYFFTRVLMLCTVLYFYSSPGRIILALSMAFLFFIYRINARRQARRLQQTNNSSAERSAQRPTPTQGDIQETNANSVQTEASSSETEESRADSSNSSDENTMQSGPSAFQVAVTFVKTFFTSLVPDHPLPVELN